jgi:methionyl-tRNA formyltransferase
VSLLSNFRVRIARIKGPAVPELVNLLHCPIEIPDWIMMNVVFMGTPDFSVSFLNTVREARHTVSAVVTQPDRPKGRGRKLQAPPVKEAALELGIPVFQPESLKDDQFCEELAALKPDLFVVVAFSILPKKVLAIPARG